MNKAQKVKWYFQLLIILPILITPLIYTHLTPDNQLSIRYIFIGVFTVLLTGMSIFKLRTNKFIQFKRGLLLFLIPLFFFLLISGISLLWTNNLGDGIYILGKFFIFSLLVIMIFLTFSDVDNYIPTLIKVINTLAFIIICIGVYQLLEITASNDLSHSGLYDLTATFAHKNIYTQVLLFCLPFSLYAAIIYKKVWKSFGIMISLGLLILITLSMSRAVWLAAFFSITVTGIIAFKFRENKQFSLKKPLLYSIGVLFVISSTVAIYSHYDKSQAFLKQTTKILKLDHGTAKDRLQLWNKTLQLSLEKPIGGYGLASWKIKILKQGNTDLKSEDNLTFYQRPHNDFLWIWSEQGIIGILAYIMLFFSTFIFLIKMVTNSEYDQYRPFILVVIFSLIAFIIYSFFSFPIDRIEHLLFLALMFGFTLSLYNQGDQQKGFRLSVVSISLIQISSILILIFFILFGSMRFLSEYHLQKAFDAKIKKDWPGVIASINHAQTNYYQIDPFSTPLSWHKGIAHYNLGQMELAKAEFEQAKIYNPHHIHVLNNLATIHGIMGNIPIAISYYKKAIQIAPNFEDALFNITTLYFQTKSMDSALVYFEKIKNPASKTKHQLFIDNLVSPHVIKLEYEIDEEYLRTAISDIRCNPEWLKQIVISAGENDNPIKKQILLDALYVLHKQKSLLTKDQADSLMNKYDNLTKKITL